MELTEHVARRANGDFLPTVLVAGLVAGSWSHRVTRERAVLTVRLLRGTAPAELEAEAMRMLGLLAPAVASRAVGHRRYKP